MTLQEFINKYIKIFNKVLVPPTSNSLEGVYFVSGTSKGLYIVSTKNSVKSVHKLFDMADYYTKAQADTALSGKVDKEAGKGLISTAKEANIPENTTADIQNIVAGINLLGDKANEAAVKALTTAVKNDTWRAVDTGHYWKYNAVIDVDNPYNPTNWIDIGEVIPSDVALKGGSIKSLKEVDDFLQPNVNYGASAFSLSCDPETGDYNTYYKTVYKRRKINEHRIVAKVWGSNPGQKLFRAFDAAGNLLPAYNRDTLIGEELQVITLDILFGQDIDSYSISFVHLAGVTPDPTNASLLIYYTPQHYTDHRLDRFEAQNLRNIRINGMVSSVQRWGDTTGPYFKIILPDRDFHLQNGHKYQFDVTVNKVYTTPITEASYLKLRVEMFRTSTVIKSPIITYISGDIKLMSKIGLYGVVSSYGDYVIPIIVVETAADNLIGAWVDNLNVQMYSSYNGIPSDFQIGVSDSNDISDLTLIQDFTASVKNESDSKKIQLSTYCDIKGISETLSRIKKEIETPHDTPYNLLIVGDSIANFQNAWNVGETPVYGNRPLCMYNKNTWTYRIWELLNPNATYYDNTPKTYGGDMIFLKCNPTPGVVSANSGVSIHGSWGQ